ncbi:hypothetical protein PDL71_12285 [Lacibacter sp. MH-610]|uniref:hypothetical protein n=1 Tax=Lacibacter sp. MH-610 TaxID=3020883 RepID=UPI00389127DF
MKRIIFILFILVSLNTFAQTDTSIKKSFIQEQLKLKKAKTYNAISWTVFGVGLTTVAISAASYPKDMTTYIFRTPTQEEIENRRKQDNAIKFALGGLAAVAASIPMILNSSSKLKKVKLIYRSETVLFDERFQSNITLNSFGVSIKF